MCTYYDNEIFGFVLCGFVNNQVFSSSRAGVQDRLGFVSICLNIAAVVKQELVVTPKIASAPMCHQCFVSDILLTFAHIRRKIANDYYVTSNKTPITMDSLAI